MVALILKQPKNHGNNLLIFIFNTNKVKKFCIIFVYIEIIIFKH